MREPSAPAGSLHPDLLPPVDRAPIAAVAMLHAEDAAHLRHVRSLIVRAPHAGLRQLARHDERLAAHLDGLVMAGAAGSRAVRDLLERPTAAHVFVVAVHAIERRDTRQWSDLLALLPMIPGARSGLLSALGWMSPRDLRGIVRALIDSGDPARRDIGLAGCAMHRVDPGPALACALREAPTPAWRAGAARIAGALGRVDLRDLCADAADVGDADARCDAAIAAVALGDRGRGLDALRRLAHAGGPAGERALGLLLKRCGPDEAREQLRAVQADPAARRTLLRAVGIAGLADPLPWLIDQMRTPESARLAGEAFCMLTGVDLEGHHLDRPAPEGLAFGPSDDPAAADVALDEDEHLAWPDADAAARWWEAHGLRLAAHPRLFMGGPPTPARCLHVLCAGRQRQRRHAAELLCLFEPTWPLFNVDAPAWRQQRDLASMEGRAPAGPA